MKIIKSIILLIFILTIITKIIAEEIYYPYFMTVESGEIKNPEYISNVTYENVKHCLHWWAYKVDGGEYPAYISTNWCTDHPFELLPAGNNNGFQIEISAEDFKTRAGAAINQWNVITDDDHNIFAIDNSSTSYKDAIFIVVEKEWERDEKWIPSNITLALDEYKTDYWAIVYWNDYYQSQPGDEYTIIYLNGDTECQQYWAWSCDANPGSGYLDLQYIIMHELGHIVGFGDDIDEDDGITTIMQHGDYTNRYVEQELRNSFEALYGVDTTSPILNESKPKENNNEN